MNTEIKHTLQEAAAEIRSLRRQNEVISARLEVFDQMMRLFHTKPDYGRDGGIALDTLWKIEQLLKNNGDGNERSS